MTDTEKVSQYMQKLEHPMKPEIEAIRAIIKSNRKISERIKWNAPSYYYKEDLVTFHIRPEKYVLLVFHNKVIPGIKSKLLQGDYKDRRMAYFHNMQEIKTGKRELTKIINTLIKMMDEKL